MEQSLRVGIVGGSLVGLCTAISLARSGLGSIVFERAVQFDSATGIGIDPAALLRVTGTDPRKSQSLSTALPMIYTHRYTTSWNLVHAWLRGIASSFPNIQLMQGLEVVDVRTDEDGAVLDTTDGKEWRVDCVVGADGYRSIVRRRVERSNSEPSYGGAVIWRGLYHEEANAPSITESGGAVGRTSQALRLIAYPVPGRDGSTEPGRRSVNWGWYDGSRLNLLERLGCVRDGRVIRSAQHEELAFLRNELDHVASQHWPSPWRSIVRTSLSHYAWFATPVAEYLPRGLVAGRVGLVGDAAHVAAPVTGAGLATGLEDVLALTMQLQSVTTSKDVPSALLRYQRSRLPAGRQLVTYGQSQMTKLLQRT